MFCTPWPTVFSRKPCSHFLRHDISAPLFNGALLCRSELPVACGMRRPRAPRRPLPPPCCPQLGELLARMVVFYLANFMLTDMFDSKEVARIEGEQEKSSLGGWASGLL